MKGPRIRSGGQTGVDRAALDAAILSRRPYEGFCPKDGWAEDLAEPPGLLKFYPCLETTPSADPEQRSEWNVCAAAATLVVVLDADTYSPGTQFTIACAQRLGKPCTVIDLSDRGALDKIEEAMRTLTDAQSLNIAGPRESECPGIYDRCLAVFLAAFR